MVTLNLLNGFSSNTTLHPIMRHSDVPPLDDTRYNLIKGGINGQKGIYTRADHQDDLVTTSASSTGIVPVIMHNVHKKSSLYT